MLNAEQLFTTYRNGLESLYAANPSTPESVKKLVETNLQAAQSTFDTISRAAQAMATAKSPQELFELQSTLMKSIAEQSVAYSQQLFEIASASVADAGFGKAAQGFAGLTPQPFAAAVENMFKNVPAGSEPFAAAMKNAMTAASSAAETMQKAMLQAGAQAEANLSAMTGAKPAKGSKAA